MISMIFIKESRRLAWKHSLVSLARTRTGQNIFHLELVAQRHLDCWNGNSESLLMLPRNFFFEKFFSDGSRNHCLPFQFQTVCYHILPN